MNIRFYIFFSLLLSISIFNYSFAHELNEKKINSLIKKYIVDNPKLIEDTLKKLNQDRSVENFKSALNDLKKIPNPKLINKKANITIYEFFDYNCGYCKSVMNSVFNLHKKDKKINIVFVEYPILSNSSLTAAISSLAAQNQAKYFEFHAKLMSHTGKIDEELIFSIAKELKIDIEQLKKDYSNQKLMIIINKNREVANRLNIRGTPAFIIGNTIYPGAMSEKDIEKAIEIERKK